MKILHLIDSFDARFERDQIKLVELLEKRGYNLTVITSKYPSQGAFGETLNFRSFEKKFSKAKILHMPGAKIHTPFSKNPSILYLPSSRIFTNYDIIHGYTFGTYSSLLAATIKTMKIMQSPKLVLRSDLSTCTYEKAKKAIFYKTLTTYPFKTADAVYAYTNYEKRLYTSLGIDDRKIWVIPIGVDFKKFSKVPIKRNRHVTIGYLGRFCFEKGVHRIVQPLCKMLDKDRKRKVMVVFAGTIDDADYAHNLMPLLKKYDSFKYLGYLRSAEKFFSICDIVLVPSLTETGAITVIEAMAAGKTVIASNIHPIKEYIKHGYSGFLFNEEKDVFAYLDVLLETPSLIKQVGKRARKEAAKYDWNLVIHCYEKMYESVMAGKRQDCA